MTNLQTCRLCKKCNFETPERLIKYGPRHNVHLSCALTKWGVEFIERLPLYQLGGCSALILAAHEGALKAVQDRHALLCAQEAEREAHRAR